MVAWLIPKYSHLGDQTLEWGYEAYILVPRAAGARHQSEDVCLQF